MRATYTKVFTRDSVKLREMLSLRKQGWSMLALARKYGVDHSSVSNMCEKYHVVPLVDIHYILAGIRDNSHIRIKKIKVVRSEPKDLWEVDEFGERINRGRTYRDYLKKAGIKYQSPQGITELHGEFILS